MKNLLYKEFRLCMVPMVPLFYLFALMVLIPSYPYLVAGFFTCNALFYVFNQNAISNDLTYSVMLPVSKKEIVRGRIVFCVIIQMIMFVLFIPMILINQLSGPAGNPAGVDASITLLGALLTVFLVFNTSFLPAYYKNPSRLGKHFLRSVIIVFVWIFLVEGTMGVSQALQEKVSVFAWIANRLDCFPKTTEAVVTQLILLAICALVYGLGMVLIFRRSVKNFELVDL